MSRFSIPIVLNFQPSIRRLASILAVLGAAALGGCIGGPHVIPVEQYKAIDRSIVETPADSALVLVADHLNVPTAMCVDMEEGDRKGSVIIAEGGAANEDVRISAIKPDGTVIVIYPRPHELQFLHPGLRMYGPIGGMVIADEKIIISHRDGHGMGAISALSFDGELSTIVADLPAQGDYAVTDVALNPVNGRLYFGLGTATNSGVVGLDNWQVGWVGESPDFCDVSYVPLKLLGYRFDTKNPRAGLFGGADIAVTAPYQPFNSSNRTRIPASKNNRPGGAIYSADPTGGDLRVEAHGIHLPRGLAFNEFGNLYFTNDGMEMRGTRPVKDDPDALLRLSPGALGAAPFYGWPDYSTDLYPITDARFQPPMELIVKSGYPELSSLIDHHASNLDTPDSFRSQLLFGVFPSQSGAAKVDFVPGNGPFKTMRGDAIVALSGDRAPFATSGQKLIAPVGFKIMRVDVDMNKRQTHDFINNTAGQPASLSGISAALERPCDVKFSIDGTLYVLDMGRMTVVNGRERISHNDGRLFKLVALSALPAPATEPAPYHPPLR